MEGSVNLCEEQWLLQFNKEIYGHSVDETEEFALARIVKKFLLSGDEFTAQNAADEIDDEIDQNGMDASFLLGFWHEIWTLARHIHFDNSKQEKLVDLLCELRALPARRCEIYGNDCFVWTRDQVFCLSMDDEWNRRFPHQSEETTNGKRDLSLRELCDQWTNLSSFFARGIEAGLIFRMNFPIVACRDALEEVLTGPRRDCMIRVAAQYIQLSGRSLAKLFLKGPKALEGPCKWKRWAESFWKISQEHDDLSLATAAEEASKRMTTLYQEAYPAVAKADSRGQSDSINSITTSSNQSVADSGANGESTNTTVDVEDAHPGGFGSEGTAAVKAMEVAQADAVDRATAWWLRLRANAPTGDELFPTASHRDHRWQISLSQV